MTQTENLSGAYECPADGKTYRYFGKVVSGRPTVWEARVFDGSKQGHPQDFLSEDGFLFVAKGDWGSLETSISAEGVRPLVWDQIDQWVRTRART